MHHPPKTRQTGIEKMASVMTPAEREFFAWLVKDLASRMKRGVIERKSAAKSISARRNVEIALAVRQGRPEDADRLRWKYYPETMRKRQMAAAVERDPKP